MSAEDQAGGSAAPRVPAIQMASARSLLDGQIGPDVVCTLEGGPDAMRTRIDDWQAILAYVTGRRPADGGVTLTFDHDADVTVELARLAAAEFACCSFFTFGLSVGPEGMRFTVSAPEDARPLVTAMFGTGDSR